MKIGDYDIYPLSDGFFGLDGGAMFGVVPKPVWEKTNPPDEKNRIRLALRPLLVVTPTELVLIDTGIGDKFDAGFAERFRVEKPDSLFDSLARAGFKPEDITVVILTHLHFDHCGGSTVIRDGRPMPSFPNARYVVQKIEWQEAINPNRRSRASYLSDNFLPIQEMGLLELVDGSTELIPGIELLHTGGHTKGMQVVKIKGMDRTAIFWSDMIPTRGHIPVPYIMGYDLFPLRSMEQKEKLLSQAVAEGWLSFLEHDPDVFAGQIIQIDNRYKFQPIEFQEDL
ncbi:MAG: MBL fold metallo-hydrolase [bacterium]